MAQITEQVAEGNEKEEYVYTDFQGNRYDNKESYLRAVAADKNMANKINYNSDMGRQIEAAVSVKEREINAKSKSDVMQEIFHGWHRLNYNEKIWSEKEDHPKFVIEDFQERKHTSLDSYMQSLAKDEMLKDKIDKFSDVGRADK
jgi:hypothetical protein